MERVLIKTVEANVLRIKEVEERWGCEADDDVFDTMVLNILLPADKDVHKHCTQQAHLSHVAADSTDEVHVKRTKGTKDKTTPD